MKQSNVPSSNAQSPRVRDTVCVNMSDESSGRERWLSFVILRSSLFVIPPGDASELSSSSKRRCPLIACVWADAEDDEEPDEEKDR